MQNKKTQALANAVKNQVRRGLRCVLKGTGDLSKSRYHGEMVMEGRVGVMKRE